MILPTDGSDDHSVERPNLEQAYRLLSASKLSSDFSGFMFAPSFSMVSKNAEPRKSQEVSAAIIQNLAPNARPDATMEQSIFSD